MNDDELKQEVDRHRHTLYGNGSKGLDERVALLEGHLFANPKTGEPGLIQEMRSLREALTSFTTALNILKWLMAFLGLTGLLEIFRLLGITIGG